MGRITEYFCDTCGREFGNLSHLNLKGGDLFRSIPPAVAHKNIKSWAQQRITPGRCQGEWHFCDTICLKQWVDKLEQLPKENS